MRLRKVVAIFGSAIVFLIVLMVYTTMDLTLYPSRKDKFIREEYQAVSLTTAG